MRRRNVLARSARRAVELLESRLLLSSTVNVGTGTASINGIAYIDAGSTGNYVNTDVGAAGATVELLLVGAAVGTTPATAQADASGNFSFTNLAAGQYTETLVAQTGYVVQPPGSAVITVSVGDVVTYDIGELPSSSTTVLTGKGTVTGTLFDDATQSDVYTPSVQQFFTGDTVYLDLNGSGVMTTTDPTTITNNLGQYTFSNVAVGSYQVRVVPRTGYHQDPPGFDQVNVYSGATTSQNVGENDNCTISGTVFQDLTGKDTLTAGAPVVAGEIVYLDENFDGALEAGKQNPSDGTWSGEPNVTTDSNGHFLITGLGPGLYRIAIQSNSGFVQDGIGYVDVTLTQGEDYITNLGEGAPTSISGVVFNDKNGNGVQDPNELGIPNQTVFIDNDQTGVPEAAGANGPDGQPNPAADPTATTSATGAFTITGMGPGTYTVRLAVPPGAVQTGPNAAGNAYVLTLGNGQTLMTQDFGIQAADLTLSVVSLPTKPVFGGVAQKAVVKVSNVGSLTADGTTDILLWAQTTNIPLNTATASEIGDLGGVQLNLAPGRSKTLSFIYSFPLQEPTGTYYVAAQVSPDTITDVNSTNNVTANIGPISVTLPVVNLGLTYANVTDNPPQEVDTGYPANIALVLTNTGNVATDGALTFRIYLSQQNVIEPTSIVVKTLRVTMHVKPGSTHLFHISVPYPTGTLGSEYIIAYVDAGTSIGEPSLVNSVAVSTPTLFH